MDIREEGGMRVRMHQGYGHGLEPGTDADINCASCTREDIIMRELDAAFASLRALENMYREMFPQGRLGPPRTERE